MQAMVGRRRLRSIGTLHTCIRRRNSRLILVFFQVPMPKLINALVDNRLVLCYSRVISVGLVERG